MENWVYALRDLKGKTTIKIGIMQTKEDIRRAWFQMVQPAEKGVNIYRRYPDDFEMLTYGYFADDGSFHSASASLGTARDIAASNPGDLDAPAGTPLSA